MALVGHVHAPVDAVFDAIAWSRRPVEDGARFLADEASRTVVLERGRWYRAEWRVLEDEVGSRVEHEIVSVARLAVGPAPMGSRRILAAAPGEYQQLLTELVESLEQAP